MFLCHFPGGAPSGIIAACSDTRLRAGISEPAISTRAPAECRETPVFDEQDQWLVSCGQRFCETASGHHAYRAWRRPAYYD
jgi:hypothetical protein